MLLPCFKNGMVDLPIASEVPHSDRTRLDGYDTSQEPLSSSVSGKGF